jgi:hypothetical protein
MLWYYEMRNTALFCCHVRLLEVGVVFPPARPPRAFSTNLFIPTYVLLSIPPHRTRFQHQTSRGKGFIILLQ